MTELVIRGSRLLTPHGIREGAVCIRDGVISAITAIAEAPVAPVVIDASDDVVMAGLVDTHVHVNEPGRTEWEGFASATRSAAAGGVTTLFDMPLNSIPATNSVAALDTKRVAAIERIAVDVGMIGGVVPGNANELAAMHAAGVRLFKCFLVPSGVDEFELVTEADLRLALPVLARLDAVLLVHAEVPHRLRPVPVGDPRRYATYLASRPDEAETDAVAMMIRLAEEFEARVHIVHLTSAASVPLLRAARQRGVRISAETCPHYLVFTDTDVPDGATQFKCAPPIRDAATRDALWDALLEGDVEMIVSDHSPCPPAMKDPVGGDFFSAWGGIASLQLGLPAVWTEARRRGIPLERITDWMSASPARLAKLGARKGRLAPGCDADIVIWNPDAEFDVEPSALYHRHGVTPYAGRRLRGMIRATYLRGRLVYGDGGIVEPVSGRLV